MIRSTILCMLTLFCMFGCHRKKVEKPVNETQTVSKGENHEGQVLHPEGLLIRHIGPERKPIWPLVLYCNATNLGKIKEMARAKISDTPYFRNCIYEEVEQKTLKTALDIAADLGGNESVSFGASELLFWQRANSTEAFFLTSQSMYAFYAEMKNLLDQNSHLHIYMKRISYQESH